MFLFRVLAVLAVGCLEMAQAQKPQIEWEIRITPTPTNLKSRTLNDSFFIASSKTQIRAYRVSNGSVAWEYSFQEKFGIKSFEWQEWNRDLGVIFLGNSDDKAIKYFVDEMTGNEIWHTDRISEFKKYNMKDAFTSGFVKDLRAFPIVDGADIEMVDIRTGKTIWSNESVLTGQEKELEFACDGMTIGIRHRSGSGHARTDYIDAASGTAFAGVVFEKPGIKGYRFKCMAEEVYVAGQRAKIQLRYPDDPNSTSGKDRVVLLRAVSPDDFKPLWELSFMTKIVGSLVENSDIIDFKVLDGTLFVITNDIIAVDLAAGKKLWQIENQSSDTRIFPKKAMYFDLSRVRVASDGVFISSFKTDSFRKVDLKTGKDIWIHSFKKYSGKTFLETVEFGTSLILPSGGRFPYQAESKKGFGLASLPIGGIGGLLVSVGVGYEWTTLSKKKEFQGNANGVYSFDRNTGTLQWSVELDRLSNIVLNGDRLYVGDKKRVLCLNPATGAILFDIDLAKSAIGNIHEIELDSLTQLILVHGDKGLCALQASDGKLLFEAKTGDNYFCMTSGAQWVVVTDADDEMKIEEITLLDIQTGKIGPKCEIRTPTPAPSHFMTKDGQCVLNYSLGRLQKLNVAIPN